MIASQSVLLALDTSTHVGSVGVCRGSEVVAYRLLLEEGAHASTLVPQIKTVLEDAGVDREEVEGILVGRGPGSFTGIRVAAATARGLSMGLGVPIWPVSSLAAAGASYDAPVSAGLPPALEKPLDRLGEEASDWPRFVLFDARADRVYAGCYRFRPDGMETLVHPVATTVGEVLGSPLPEPVVFCGDGAVRHADAVEAAGLAVAPFPAGLPTPHGLLRVHLLLGTRVGEPVGSRWEPEYLRGSWSRPTALVAESSE